MPGALREEALGPRPPSTSRPVPLSASSTHTLCSTHQRGLNYSVSPESDTWMASGAEGHLSSRLQMSGRPCDVTRSSRFSSPCAQLLTGIILNPTACTVGYVRRAVRHMILRPSLSGERTGSMERRNAPVRIQCKGLTVSKVKCQRGYQCELKSFHSDKSCL